MNAKSKYNTRQKEILIKYLQNSKSAHVSASDVCEYLKNQGESIGQSTVYRQLERLVDEGIVNKYSFDSTSPACFEYVGSESHAKAGTCFHCRCEKCGKLIHLHCEELEEIGGHLLKDHGFRLNTMRTVLYGVCEDCAGEE
ncbi:MAG: transcriptional repressor [Lachnospiraceae bacterium]|nr:transcriptional repressor [Lachnospiraceae bacterium]